MCDVAPGRDSMFFGSNKSQRHAASGPPHSAAPRRRRRIPSFAPHWNTAILVSLCLAAPPAACQSASATLPFARDVRTGSPLLSLSVAGGAPVLILADGALRPDGEQRAVLHLAIDGHAEGSAAVLDWHGAHYPVTHGFRLLAAATVPPGQHRITLEAASDGSAGILPGATLSVLERPAAHLRQQMASPDTPVIEPDVPGGLTDADQLPHTVFAQARAAGGPAIALAAGSVSYAGDGKLHFGDAWWGLWLDGSEATANEASYADNDICRCAELTAPLALQGYFAGDRATGRVIGVGATAETWGAATGTNTVRYRVQPDSALVLLDGGMQVAGGLQVVDAAHGGGGVRRFPYYCAGSATGYTGCNQAGTPRVIGAGTVDVPPHHDRAILFSAALRIQGGSHDHGGRIEMWLELDGRRASAVAVQDLAPRSSVSTRTMTLSYLAGGATALAAGPHPVALVVRAAGDFQHLAVTRNVPLIWFD